MSWQKLGTTVGLCRYSEKHEHQAEQIYVDKADEPELIPHPDGGHLVPRTYRIRKGRGYSFTAVLDLTQQQAIDLALILLDDADPRPVSPADRRWSDRVEALRDRVNRDLAEIAEAFSERTRR